MSKQRFQNVVVVGATSLIAQEVARILSYRHRSQFFLIARNQSNLDLFAEDLATRGGEVVGSLCGDFVKSEFIAASIDSAISRLETVDLLIVAHGYLPDEAQAQIDPVEAEYVLQVNFNSVVAFLVRFTSLFERQKRGQIAVISSVAGDRGRRSLYVYSAAKAGLSAYLQGLRARLWRSGVVVSTIKPGPVNTPMTSGRDISTPLMADAKQVAEDIYYGILKKRDVVYAPWYWRWIMCLVKAVPESWAKRIKA